MSIASPPPANPSAAPSAPKSTASTSGGHTAERTEHGEMVFTKDLDVVSPLLYQHASGGTTFDEVTIDFLRADGEGNRVKYLEIELKYVIISHAHGDHDGGAKFLQDRIPSARIVYGGPDWDLVEKAANRAGGRPRRDLADCRLSASAVRTPERSTPL